jgi:hypothetical protein
MKILTLIIKTSLVDLDIVLEHFHEISKRLQVEKRLKLRCLQMAGLC